jgi:hypothetical protein
VLTETVYVVPLPVTLETEAPVTPVVVSEKSEESTPVTLCENVTVKSTEAAFVGVLLTRVMEETVGEEPPHGASVVAVFRGLGAPAAKSELLLSVSVQPLTARMTAVVVEGAAVGAVSEQFAVAPKPTWSTTFVPGQAPFNATVLLTSATLPAVADIAIVPVASGVGSELTPFAPAPSATRRYWPGESETFGRLVTDHAPVPVAAPYCTDQPFTETVVFPRLNNSM